MHRRQLDPKVSVSIVFVVAMFMSIMDGTIVNVALPSIGRQLGVPSTASGLSGEPRDSHPSVWLVR
jgi:MFS family permease